MLQIRDTTAFRKDVKRVKKQGKQLKKLQTVILILEHEKPLTAKYKDHSLSGNWSNHRECHIEPDWLLIYYIIDGLLVLVRTGSHSELFNK